MRTFLTILLTALASFGLGGDASAQKLDILASVPDLGDLVETIGGEHVDVDLLVPAGSNPHAVLPKASMLLKLSRADALVILGLDFEHSFLPAMLEKSRNAAVAVGGAGHLDIGQSIQPLKVPTSLSREQGADLHPRGNPHYNLDPANGRIMARSIRDLLQRLDPEHADDFQRRWQAWDDEAQARIRHWEAAMKPLRGRKIVVYHDSWPYFAERYGLEVVATVEPKPGIAPSAAHLVKVKRLMREHEVKVILMEPWYNAKRVQSLAKDGVTVVRVPVTCGSDAKSKHYLDFMECLVTGVLEAHGMRLPPPPSEAESTGKREAAR